MAKYRFVTRSEHPNLMWASFTLPPAALSIGALQANSIVKVGVEAEGSMEFFWATITERSGQGFSATVTNDLKLTHLHGLDDGDLIHFGAGEILQIYAD